MNIDWIIAIGLFIVFISWSFVYYTGFFSINPDMRAGVEGISGSVMDYLEVDSYKVPVRFDSSGPGTRTLWMDFEWPGDSRNSTRMFSGNQSLPCYITGNRIYWRTDVEAGQNTFMMQYQDLDTGLFCDSVFPLSNASQAIPWAAEKGSIVSQQRISQMLAADFRSFRDALGVGQDFRVEIDTESGTYSQGPDPPLGYDVYVKETPGVTGGMERVTVRVLIW